MGSRRYAFTLVELVLVIVLVALSLGILLSSGSGGVIAAKRMARQAACASQLRALGEAYLAYTNLNGQFPPSAPGIPELNELTFLVSFYGDFRYGFGPLTWERRLTADYYVCPLAGPDTRNWWHDAPIDPGTQYPFPVECPWWHHVYPNPNPDKVREDPKSYSNSFSRASYNIRSYVSYKTPSWFEADGWSAIPGNPWPFGRDPALVRGKRALIADMLFTPEVISNAHGDGVNVFYIDGSVVYRTDDILLNRNLESEFGNTNIEIEHVWNSLDK
jgi:prepilin-type processing-associated H-X9-DG protein